jgi:hypothetical protein
MELLAVNIEHLVFFIETLQYANYKLSSSNLKKQNRAIFAKIKTKTSGLIQLVIDTEKLKPNQTGMIEHGRSDRTQRKILKLNFVGHIIYRY